MVHMGPYGKRGGDVPRLAVGTVRGRSEQRGGPKTDSSPPNRPTATQRLRRGKTDPESGTRSPIYQDGFRGLEAAHENPTPRTEPTPDASDAEKPILNRVQEVQSNGTGSRPRESDAMNRRAIPPPSAGELPLAA